MWQLDGKEGTSAGLLGGGGEELVPDGVPDIFLSIFEGRAGFQSGEGGDCVIEVSMSLIVWHTNV